MRHEGNNTLTLCATLLLGQSCRLRRISGLSKDVTENRARKKVTRYLRVALAGSSQWAIEPRCAKKLGARKVACSTYFCYL
jgi:hypothetical protein